MSKFFYLSALLLLLLLIRLTSFGQSMLEQTESYGKDFEGTAQMNEALQQEVELTKDPNLGYVPHERILHAVQYAQELENTGTRSAIAGIVWKERGPNNLSGRTQAIMIDPNDATKKTVFAGSVSGGLWKCTDITATTASWTPVNDLLANLAVTALAYDPSNTQVMYMGTGEGWFNADAIRGDGIFKSTDGGATWSQLASTSGNNDFNYVQKIIVHHLTGAIYAATRSATAGYGGVMKSTDGGTTWTKVLSSSSGAATDRCADIEIGTDDSLYAAMGIFTTDGIYRSTSGNLNSWTKLNTGGNGFPTSGFYRCEIACAANSAATLYVLAQASSNNTLYNIYKSTNHGTTWTTCTKPIWHDVNCTINSTDFTRAQAWYNLTAAVDPNNANIIFIGGIDIMKSADGGTTWTQLTSASSVCNLPYFHSDQHIILYEPNNSNAIYFGNDGGIYKTSDGGATFVNRSRGFNTTQFYSCAMNPAAYNNQFLAGSQDNGSVKYTDFGINTGLTVSGGDGGFCHIDQDQSAYQYTSTTNINLYRSSDGGNSWSNNVINNNGNFINPSDYDNAGNVLYFNYGNLSTGSNYDKFGRILNAPTASAVSNINISSASGGSYMTAVSVSQNTSNRVFFGTSNGRVIRVDNANAAAPTATLIGTPVTGASVSCITIENGNDSHLLVTYSNYGVNSVYETTNGGTSWTSVEGNLPDMPIWWALFNPSNNTQVLLATEVGVWSTDALSGASTNWSPANTGLPNVSTRMLQIRSSDNFVIAATHGRGLFSSDIFTTPHAEFKADRTITYLNTNVTFTDYSYKATSWSWNFGDGTSSALQNPVKSYTVKGTYTVTLIINSGASTATKINYITVLPNKGTPYVAADGGNFDINASDFAPEAINGTTFQRGSSNVAAKSGTYSGSYAWVTALAGNYANGSTAYLYTPNFNFTALGNYIISFYSKYNVQSNHDGFRVEYSTDKGTTWNLLGTTGGWWYNYANTTPGMAWPVNQPFFSGSNGSYTQHQLTTSALQGNANVAFRIGFKSDGTVNAAGGAIDNFEIMGPGNTTLPIELVSFTGENEGTSNILNWSTQSEMNNEDFDIERSVNTYDWEVIGFVKGNGTTNAPHDYSFDDRDIQQPIYYYRLKQHDFETSDDKTSYSNVISLTSKMEPQFYAAVNPTIISNTFAVSYANASGSYLRLTLFSVSGEIVFEKNYPKENSSGIIHIDLEREIPSQIYFLRIESENSVATLKVVKE